MTEPEQSTSKQGSRLLTGGLLTGSTVLFVAFTAVNVSNFAFHMVTSRLLVPQSYGALGSLLSIMLVLQVPMGALQVAVTQQVVERARTTGEPITLPHLLRLRRNMLITALVAALVFVALAPVFSAFLHLNSLVPGLLLAVDMFPVFLGLVPRAVLIGEQRFRPVSIALVGGAVTRLALGYVLGHTTGGVEGALIATVAGDVVMTILLVLPLRSKQRGTTVPIPLNVSMSDATAAGVAFAGLFLLVGVDTVMARHYLNRVSSGVYVAAATAARSALFLSTAVGLIALPRFAATNGEGPVARAVLVRSLAAVGSMGLGAAALIALAPQFFVTLLLGDQYADAADVVGLLAFGAASLGIVTLLVYFHLARRSPSAWLAWIGVVVLVILLTLFHNSRQAIAVTATATTALLAAATLVPALRKTRGESKLALAQLHRPPPPIAASSLDLTVVVPFYNPGARFLPNIERIAEVLQEENVTFEIIAVSDGSTDGSAEALQEIQSDVVRGVVLTRNWGKGEALRVGLSMGRGRYLGFIDADGDIDASLLKPFLRLIELYEPDIILGSKRHPMSEVVYPTLRRIYSWGYQQFIRVLFQLDVRDTQTGLKLIKREVVAAVLPRMVERGFAFDLELFVVAQRLGYRKVFEAPIRIGTRFTSTVSRRAVIAMFGDTIKIFYRLRVLHQYELEPPATEKLQMPSDAVEVDRRD